MTTENPGDVSETPPSQDWKSMQAAAGPFPLEAFQFVREGLSFTSQRRQEEVEMAAETDRHVTGQELCLGLRDFAIDQYGLLAPAVLRHWKVARTDDFGRIVFAMIDAGLMSRTSEDTLDDFRGVYSFREAFNRDEIAARIGPN